MLPQVEFALNSVVNRTTNYYPFSIVYTKVSNFSVDLLAIPNPKSKAATTWSKDNVQFHKDIKEHKEKMNEQYKCRVNEHRTVHLFQEGELVMIHLNRN